MNHGVVEVFAYQETLLIMAVFGIALLTMVWVGFRRWLQHKEKTSRLIAEQTAEFSALIERVEARLNAIERAQPDAQVDALPAKPPASRDEAQPSP